MVDFNKKYTVDEFSNLIIKHPAIIKKTNPSVLFVDGGIVMYNTIKDTIIDIITPNKQKELSDIKGLYNVKFLKDYNVPGRAKYIGIIPIGSEDNVDNILLLNSQDLNIRLKIQKFDGKIDFWKKARLIFSVNKLAGPRSRVRAAERTYAAPGEGNEPLTMPGAKRAKTSFDDASNYIEDSIQSSASIIGGRKGRTRKGRTRKGRTRKGRKRKGRTRKGRRRKGRTRKG